MAEGFDLGNLLFMMKAADAGFTKTISAGLSQVKDVDSAIDEFADKTTAGFRRASSSAREWVRQVGRAGNQRLRNPLAGISTAPLLKAQAGLRSWTQNVRKAGAARVSSPFAGIKAAPAAALTAGLRLLGKEAGRADALLRRIKPPRPVKISTKVETAAKKLSLGLSGTKDVDRKIEALMRLAKKKLSAKLRMSPIAAPVLNLGPLGAAQAMMGRTGDAARRLGLRLRQIGNTPIKLSKIKMPTLPKFKPVNVEINARNLGKATREVGLFAKTLLTVKAPAALKQLPGIFSRIAGAAGKSRLGSGLFNGLKAGASGAGGAMGMLGGLVSKGAGIAGAALGGLSKVAMGALGGLPGLALSAASGVGGAMSTIANTTKWAVAGLLAAGVASIKLAADATEMENKFDTAFGSSAKGAKANLEAFADQVGRSRVDIKSMAADIQTVFVPFGFARDQASQLSQQMTQLAVDMGSFYNTSDSDAMEALQSAVVGNHETMRRYGVVITEATLKQQLMAMGVKGGTEAATEQQKVLARLALIMKGTKDAQGDATKTSGSFSNQVKSLWGGIKDLGVIIGNALIPAMTLIVGKTKDAINWAKSHESSIASWGQTLAQWTQTGIGWIEAFVAAVMNVDLTWATFKLAGEQALTTVFERTKWFATNVWTAIKFPFENFPRFVAQSIQGAVQVLKNFGSAIKTLFTSSFKDIASGKAFEGFKPVNLGKNVKMPDGPAWKEFKGTDFNDKWEENARQWEERMGGATKKIGEQTKTDLGVDLNEMMKNAESKAKVKVKAEFEDLEGLWKKNIMAQFDDEDDTGKQTVAKLGNIADQQKQQIQDAERQKKELVDALGAGGSIVG